MTETYDKLVRDRIPEIIRRTGRDCTVETLDVVAYRQALRTKLVEEAREVAAAADDALVDELADVCEVLDALLAAHGLEEATVRAAQARRRAERGGFARRLRLRAIH